MENKEFIENVSGEVIDDCGVAVHAGELTGKALIVPAVITAAVVGSVCYTGYKVGKAVVKKVKGFLDKRKERCESEEDEEA